MRIDAFVKILLVIIGILTSYVSIVALPFFMAFELFIGFVLVLVVLFARRGLFGLVEDLGTRFRKPKA